MTSRSSRYLLEGGAAPVPPSIPTPALLSEISWEVYVDAALEGAPPTALAEQAQNTGISDGATMTTMTDWSSNARHLSVDAARPFTWQEDGGHGYAALRAPTSTNGKGAALPTAVSLNATGIITVVVAVEDNELSSSGGGLFSLYRGNFYNSMIITRSNIDQWSMRDDSGGGTGSVPDRWFIAAGERRTRLHVYEIDRTANPIVIRRWDNGVPQPSVTVTRGTGTIELTRLFALSTFSGNGGVYNCDVLFAGVINAGLTQAQRDAIASRFYAVTGEPVWSQGWSYTQAQPWLATLINLKWESNPLLAPAAWRARAQNTGISDLDNLPGLTEWSSGNHMVSPLDTQRLIYQATGLNGYPTGNADGVDDEVESTTAITLPADAQMITVAKPSAAVRVLAEHGPNATSGANGMALLSIPAASAEFAGQLRRASAYYRNRGPWADGNAHVVSWEGNANAAGIFFRVDKLSATSSTSNSGAPSGDYTEKLHLGARSGGLFPMSGQVSFFAVVKNNRAAARVIEHQAALDYGVI